ncbi:MAG: 1-acyl-sn-glycerol-3-phosphate acyltransferase [Cryomorphaceae bacterium]
MGTPVLQKLYAKILYDYLGWRLEGELPWEHKRLMLVFLPHTSNWDFIIALLFIRAERIKVTIFAKDSFHFFPLKYFYGYFGVVPIKRKVSDNFVDQAAALYDDGAELWTAMAPEGTRSYKQDLRSGYYYLAKKAGIKISLVGPDFGNKTFKILPPRDVLETFEADAQNLIEFSRECSGKIPQHGI